MEPKPSEEEIQAIVYEAENLKPKEGELKMPGTSEYGNSEALPYQALAKLSDMLSDWHGRRPVTAAEIMESVRLMQIENRTLAKALGTQGLPTKKRRGPKKKTYKNRWSTFPKIPNMQKMKRLPRPEPWRALNGSLYWSVEEFGFVEKWYFHSDVFGKNGAITWMTRRVNEWFKTNRTEKSVSRVIEKIKRRNRDNMRFAANLAIVARENLLSELKDKGIDVSEFEKKKIDPYNLTEIVSENHNDNEIRWRIERAQSVLREALVEAGKQDDENFDQIRIALEIISTILKKFSCESEESVDNLEED